MLHLEYREIPYKGTAMEIKVDNASEIPGLRDMLLRNFIIENPAKTFAGKMKAGGYDSVDEERVVWEAERTNILADAWKTGPAAEMRPTENVLMVLTRLMQLYVDAEMELRVLRENF